MPTEEVEFDDRSTNNVPEERTIHTGQKMGLNANAYATKKTVAQGMLDIALLTANASQLKYVLQIGEKHEFYHLMISMISISIILQILLALVCFILPFLSIDSKKHLVYAVVFNNSASILSFVITFLNTFMAAFGANGVAIGVGFLLIGGLDINIASHQKTANILNNVLTAAIFFVTVFNVLISAFGMKQSDDAAESMKKR